jgi:hypothetical protein
VLCMSTRKAPTVAVLRRPNVIGVNVNTHEIHVRQKIQDFPCTAADVKFVLPDLCPNVGFGIPAANRIPTYKFPEQAVKGGNR